MPKYTQQLQAIQPPTALLLVHLCSPEGDIATSVSPPALDESVVPSDGFLQDVASASVLSLLHTATSIHLNTAGA